VTSPNASRGAGGDDDATIQRGGEQATDARRRSHPVRPGSSRSAFTSARPPIGSWNTGAEPDDARPAWPPYEAITMAKGQQKPKTNNKPKLTTKEKKQKKKEKTKTRNA
jgi:hypothetical protein